MSDAVHRVTGGERKQDSRKRNGGGMWQRGWMNQKNVDIRGNMNKKDINPFLISLPTTTY